MILISRHVYIDTQTSCILLDELFIKIWLDKSENDSQNFIEMSEMRCAVDE